MLVSVHPTIKNLLYVYNSNIGDNRIPDTACFLRPSMWLFLIIILLKYVYCGHISRLDTRSMSMWAAALMSLHVAFDFLNKCMELYV